MPIAPTLQATLVSRTTRSKRLQPLADLLVRKETTYGTALETADLEVAIGHKRDTTQFEFVICTLRKMLLDSGLYLSSRGTKGQCYIVLDAADNADIVAEFSDRAVTVLEKGITLGKSTRRERLSSEERRKHDGVLEKMAHKLVLLRNSEKVWEQVYGKKRRPVPPSEPVDGVVPYEQQTDVSYLTRHPLTSSLDEPRSDLSGTPKHDAVASSERDPAETLIDKEDGA